MKRCVIRYEDGTSKSIMKTDDENAESWKLLIRPLIKETYIGYSKIPQMDDIGEEEWGRLEDVVLQDCKYFSLIPEEYHEDISYFHVKRVELISCAQ